MGRKSKYTVEQKIQASQDYISGNRSAIEIAESLNMTKHGSHNIIVWARKFKEYGEEVFHPKAYNSSYSKNFKEMIVRYYLSGTISLVDLAIKYNISSDSTIISWVSKYNNHIEIMDYDPKPEIYMTKTKKLTLEDKKDIINYCIIDGYSIKNTSSYFKCSYMQVRNLVRKYEEIGESAFLDKRGKHKSEAELDEITRLKRENEKLKKLLERKELEAEILKKVNALTRR